MVIKDPLNEWVFPSDGQSGHLNDPKKAWARLLKRAQIEDLRMHDLRRTFGSWQAALGANGYIIGKSLGHKSQQSTAIYARLNLEPPINDMIATVELINISKTIKNFLKKTNQIACILSPPSQSDKVSIALPLNSCVNSKHNRFS